MIEEMRSRPSTREEFERNLFLLGEQMQEVLSKVVDGGNEKGGVPLVKSV